MPRGRPAIGGTMASIAEADGKATEFIASAQKALGEGKTPEGTALALIAIAHRLDELATYFSTLRNLDSALDRIADNTGSL